MASLPASIEVYLTEADFTQTEILVLRRLFEDGIPVTLRELAAKTGKSTGVLDQATRKLLQKHILKKEIINGSPKYVLASYDAVVCWISEDLRRKRETLLRKEEDFASFIASLKRDQARPEMEYFEGLEGIKKAYDNLLQYGSEMLHYFPVTCCPEQDPLCDFREAYFRKRRKWGIFSRVLVHNTPLSRRYQSRDPFEYRKSVLVSEEQCPFAFEKIIVGDTVACFDHEEQKVCFIHYPQMAQSERELFESMWNMQRAERGRASDEEDHVVKAEPLPLRGILLKKGGLAAVALSVVVAVVSTFVS